MHFLILSVLAATASVPTNICDDAASRTPTAFAQGDGSQATPYVICTAEQFNLIGADVAFLDKHFELRDHLEFKNVEIIGAGDPQNAFSGHFDGNGYGMRDIELPRSSGYNFFGIFRFVVGGTVQNVRVMTRLQQWTRHKVGGVIGRGINATIDNVHTNVDLRTAASYSGGIAGSLRDSTLSNSSATGYIRIRPNSIYVGGLVGRATNVDIHSCTADVKMMTPNNEALLRRAGGLVGWHWRGTVSDSRSLVEFGVENASNNNNTIIGQQVGGLFGGIGYVNIERSYFAGTFNLSLDSSSISPIAGYKNSRSYAYDTVWDSDKIGPEYPSALGTPWDEDTMKSRRPWLRSGYNMSQWQMEHGAYPQLRTDPGYLAN